MSAHLPPNPCIEQLRKQAKSLLKAHQAGEAEAVARIRAHLPRLAHASDPEIQADPFVLQEAQHVIAREYGFKSWNWLQAVVCLDLALLARLSDREVQSLMHATDRQDLAVSLKAAPDETKGRLLSNMSAQVQADIVDEMEFFGPVPEAEIAAAQRRVMATAARLAAAGHIDWPDGGTAASPSGGPPDALDAARLRTLLGRKLDDLSPEEVVELLFQLAELARQDGILAWETAVATAADPFVQEALCLAADDTEASLLADILETRSQRAVLSDRETRGRMIVKAMACYLAWDHPRVIRHKLSAYYQPTAAPQDRQLHRNDGGQLEHELRRRLASEPLDAMTQDQLAELLAQVGELARRAGIAALAPLAEGLPDGLLKHGLRRVAAQAEREQLRPELESRLAEELQAARRRHRMVIAGTQAVQLGKTPEEVREAVDAAAHP